MEPPDYAAFDRLLSADELALRARVRWFAQERAAPLIPDYYERGVFPAQLVPELAAAGLLEPEGMTRHGPVAEGLIAQELERADAGLRSFVSVHAHLCGTAIQRFGSPAQRERYLPAMARGAVIGAFALTESTHGSDPAGLETIARRTADGYVLDGHKRWSTNATLAQIVVVWAKLDGEVRGFIVPTAAPGCTISPIEGKLSFRASASAEIELRACLLPEEALLPGAAGLRAPLQCLTEARYGIIWGVVGAAEACFEEALRYAGERRQFDRQLAGFQLTQLKLADMYGRLVQMKLLALHLGRLKEQGALHHSHVSLGKRENVRGAQAIARTARTILGAHGITSAAVSLRHAQNLETEATYEGTDEIHALALGRALTGIDAFR